MSITLLAMLTTTFLSARDTDVDNSTIRNLNLKRYLGTWYEIARFDHSFEKGMDNTQAEYTLKEDGTVRVENTGWKDGKFHRSTGKAFQPSPEKDPARLRVSFFGPFYSDYRVLMLTPDYENALVGSKSDKYLWILSRVPDPSYEVLSAMIEEARNRGYDVDKLLWVPQDDAMAEYSFESMFMYD